ncbi:MAG: glycosyltransferase family 4 protein [Thermoguttaceae bacterium]|jgi:glycosyltransferase involved in cell wall biosynthesis
MNVLLLTAGAGPMYCGSCLQSNTLAAALRSRGADCILLPVYTPLRTDEPDVSLDRLALGGIKVALHERWPLLRRMPAWLGRLLDRPALVRWAVRHGGRTRPKRLGALTLAVLEGRQGPIGDDIGRLADTLAREFRPDVIHLSSVLLAGLARPLADRLGVPVLGTLAGEDLFLAKLPPPWCEQARAALARRSADLAALVAPSRYYAEFMAGYLAVPPERIHVVPPGLNLDGHRKPGDVLGPWGLSPPNPQIPKSPNPSHGLSPSAATIGYLGRVCPDKGLHLLAEALPRLAADRHLPPLRVRAAGYLDPADRAYLNGIRRRLAAAGLADRFEYLGELDRPAKIAFLQSLDVLSLPAVCRESKALPALEGWANGIPAVLPDHGAFPELVADTGGGLLHAPGDAEALAAALARMLREPEFAAACARQAHQAVHQRYNANRMARQMIEVYEGLVRGI